MAKVRDRRDSTRKVWSQNLVIQPDLWVATRYPGTLSCQMFHKKLRGYLQFNRKERWGLLILAGVLAGLYGLSAIFPERSIPVPNSLQKDAKLDKSHDFEYKIERKPPGSKGRLLPFDPNSASESDWIEMGVPARTVRTIRNYLEKGGRFKQPRDLAKIWGMGRDDVDRLMPYVRIKDDATPLGTSKRTLFDRAPTQQSSYKPRERPPMDINGADSSAWESLPGIGPGYARRIVRYRERLGGFIRVEQVAETYQLPDSVYQRIRPLLAPTLAPVRTININEASLDSLGRHPYCGYPMARLIIRYREQHGPYETVADLLQIQRVDSIWLVRIRPYLRVE